MLAAHPDDPPAEQLRGTARLVNRPEKYDRLLDIVDRPSNGLELCLGSLQEMPGGDIYDHVRRFARRGRIGYIHFRNVRGKVPNYVETFVDDGDIDMAEIVRILRDENYGGVLIPDHTPSMTCAASWHAGMAFALGYMRALVQNAEALGPSRSLAKSAAPRSSGAGRIAPRSANILEAGEVDFGDVPAAEIGGIEFRAFECDIGRVGEHRRLAVFDQELQFAARLQAIDAARLVAGNIERAVRRERQAVGNVLNACADQPAGGRPNHRR